MSGKGFRHNSKVIWPGFTAITRRRVVKVGRNEPCPCGSGKKYKECHEAEGTPFLARLAHDRDKERMRELRQRLKEQGVPWYKRLFVRA